METIVFDLGGVLIDWNPDYLYRKIISDEKERAWFLGEICTPAWNEDQDAGRPVREGTALLVEQYPRYEAWIRAFYDRWEEMLNGHIVESLKIFNELREKGRYKLLALTNWSAETFPIARQRFDFLGHFDGILVSGEEHMRKPAPEFYKLLVERFAFRPEKAVFIDDNQRNLPPAAELGMHTIHFKDPFLLRRELVSRGIL